MGNSLASTTADGTHTHKHLEQIVVPIVCFSAIVAIHVRYLRVRSICWYRDCVCTYLVSVPSVLTSTASTPTDLAEALGMGEPPRHRGHPRRAQPSHVLRGHRTWYSICIRALTIDPSPSDCLFLTPDPPPNGPRQRTRWVLENHGRTQVAVQTLRDMLSVTTAIASAAMAFISIFIGLSKSSSASLLTCDPQDGGNPCNTFEERLKFARCVCCPARLHCQFLASSWTDLTSPTTLPWFISTTCTASPFASRTS